MCPPPPTHTGSGFLCAAMGLLVAGPHTAATAGLSGSIAPRKAMDTSTPHHSHDITATSSGGIDSTHKHVASHSTDPSKMSYKTHSSAGSPTGVPVPEVSPAHGSPVTECPAGPYDMWVASATQAEEGAGLVIGCDKVPELVAHSRAALHATVPHLMDDGTITVLHGNALDPGMCYVHACM